VAAIRENYRQELESLLAVDEAVSRIVTALRETGELANTLIVFTSDNGSSTARIASRKGRIWRMSPQSGCHSSFEGPASRRGCA
jgi:arylsulfatase A-like enzyme